MKLYLTNAGQELLYKAQGGKTLKFTRFGLGDGELNGQAIQPLTNLIDEKMQADLKRLEIKNNKVIVGMSFSNSGLSEGFYFRELGLFAEDPDTSEEILYMYANFGETSDYIDANTGKAIEENLDVEIYISDVDNISATIDGSLVYATKQDLDELRDELAGIVIPTKTSDLEKDDVYTQGQIDNKLAEKSDTSHTHVASQVTEGTFSGKVNANADAITNLGASQLRNIQVTNVDLEAGVSVLTTGDIVIIYE